MARRFLLVALCLAACADDPAAPHEDEPEHARVESSFAPSGTYAVEVRVISDDCTPAHVAPPPWQARVLVQAEGDQGRINLPLSSLSASGAARATSRSDFRLVPGYTVEHRTNPVHDCDGYAIDATLELARASTSGFEIDTTLAYGDASACGSTGPSRCTTKVAHTYTLVEAACPAECTQGEHAVAAGTSFDAPRWEIDCRC